MSDSYPCPCCGHRVLDAMPGSYEICPVCFWEDATSWADQAR
ncbi:CPCC family cysteine-rich protein [Streptomyces sp. NPDC051569]